MSIFRPHSIRPNHTRKLKKIAETINLIVKLVAVPYIVVLSLRFEEVMSFFYLNTLIVLIINIFRQSSTVANLLKIKVTSYFRFLLCATCLILIGASLFIVYMLGTVDQKWQVSVDKRVFLFKVYRDAVPNLMTLSLLSGLYLYLKSAKKTLKVVIIEHMKIQDEESKRVKIESNSYFITEFTNNLANILDLGDQSLIDQDLKFRFNFMATMVSESIMVRSVFDPMMQARKKEIHYWRSFKKSVYNRVFEYFVATLTFVVDRFRAVVGLIVLYYMLAILRDRKDIQNIFQLSYLTWCIIFCLGMNKTDQVRVAAYFVFPAFIFDQAYSQIRSIKTYYLSEGKTSIDQYKITNIAAIFWLMVYAFMLTYEDRKVNNGRLSTLISDNIDLFQVKKKRRQKTVELNMHLIFRMVAPVFRYIALATAISAGLMTINLPNALLITASLVLMKGTEYDDKYWKHYQFYILFLIILLYLARFVNGFITALNVEWIALVGVYSNNSERYIIRIESLVYAFIWASLSQFTHETMSRYKITNPEGIQKQTWRITKYIEAIIHFSSNLLQQYMIWIFHCLIFGLLFSTETTIMTILLLFAEALVFPLQLFQWLNQKGEVYRSMQKSWQWLYRLVIANVVYRYLTFFARYATIRRGVFEVVDKIVPKQLTVFILIRDNTKIDEIHSDYIFDIIVLILAFYTNYCVNVNVSTESNPQSSLKEKLIELGKQQEERMALLYRHTVTFTTSLIILKGISFVYIGYHTLSSVNAIKIVLLLLSLAYFNVLFFKMGLSIGEFKMRGVIEKSMLYFKNRFSSNVRPHVSQTLEGLKAPPTGYNRDSMHGEAYFFQFIKRMETDVVTLSNRIWPIMFVLWLAYSLILAIVRVLVAGSFNTNGFCLYIGLFRSTDSKQTRQTILFEEQIGNQVIFVMLIVEFLMVHYYFSLPDNIVIMSDTKLRHMIELMDTKVQLFLAEPRDTARLREQYILAAKTFEAMDDDQLVSYLKNSHRFYDERKFIGFKFGEGIQNDSSVPEGSDTTPNKGNLDTIDEAPEIDGRDRMEAATFRIDNKKLMMNLDMITESGGFFQKPKSEVLHASMLADVLDEDRDKEDGKSPKEKEKDRGDNAEKQPPSVLKIYMDEETSCQLKVIFKERNTHMLNISRTLNAVSYIVTRLIILPLLYSLKEQSVGNIFFFLLTVAYIFKFRFDNFESKIRLFVPALSLLIIVEGIYNCFDKINKAVKLEPAAPYLTLFSNSLLKLWIIGLVSLGFASIIWTAKFVFTKLFVIKQKCSQIFFLYQCEEAKIEIDFGLWAHKQLSWCTTLINALFVYLNDIYMTGVIVFCLINPDVKYLLVIMLVLFAYTIIMRCKKSYTTVAMEDRAAMTLGTVIKIVVAILFVLDFLTQILEFVAFFGKATGMLTKQGKAPNLSGQGSQLMIIFCLLIFDTLYVDSFVKEKRRVNRSAEIQIKYSDMCEAQEVNENKIYERVCIMMANHRLQTQIDQYLKKGILNCTADLNYHKTDVKQKLRENRYGFMLKYMDSWKITFVRIIEKAYVTMVKNINPYANQDMLYLLTKVCQIDRGIVNSTDLNLADYLSGDFKVFDSIYTDIVSFYTNLHLKEPNEYELYKARMGQFEQQMASTNFDLDVMMPDNPAEEGSALLPNFEKRERAPSEITRRPTRGLSIEDSTFGSPLERPGKRKKKQDLSAAAGFLAKELIAKRTGKASKKFQSYRNSAVFNLEEENCTVYFHNIRSDMMKASKGFMTLNLRVTIDLISSLFWSNLEQIISLFIIVVQFLNGGFMSSIILGILFFRILIEEHGGRIIWWEILNIIFFIQFILKIVATSSGNTGDGPILRGYVNYLNFICGKAETSSDLQLDAFAQISIMWLIQFIHRRIINQPEGKNLVNPGVSIARVIFD